MSIGLEGESVYVASKAGVEAFSRTFAREMSPFRVRVNCIAPGPIDTDLTAGLDEKQIEAVVQRQIIQKKFQPENVAELVELLLDDRTNSITGQVLNVGGV